MANLYDQLASGFPQDRTAPFATLTDGTVTTYADVERQSARYANLLGQRGVVAGDRVAVQTPKSLDMLMLYLGCVRAGAIFLPLNTAYTSGELAYFMEDAQPALFVCDPGQAGTIRDLAATAGVRHVETMGIGGAGTFRDAAANVSDSFASRETADDDIAAILYTSGTTGRSKGAMLSHGNLASNCLTLRDYWRFDRNDTLLHALPIFHTHGLFVATNVVLASGAQMILDRKSVV